MKGERNILWLPCGFEIDLLTIFPSVLLLIGASISINNIPTLPSTSVSTLSTAASLCRPSTLTIRFLSDEWRSPTHAEILSNGAPRTTLYVWLSAPIQRDRDTGITSLSRCASRARDPFCLQSVFSAERYAFYLKAASVPLPFKQMTALDCSKDKRTGKFHNRLTNSFWEAMTSIGQFIREKDAIANPRNGGTSSARTTTHVDCA